MSPTWRPLRAHLEAGLDVEAIYVEAYEDNLRSQARENKRRHPCIKRARCVALVVRSNTASIGADTSSRKQKRLASKRDCSTKLISTLMSLPASGRR